MAFQTKEVNYKWLDEEGIAFSDGVALLPLTTAQATAATPATGTYAFDTDKSQVLMAQSDNTYHSVTEIPRWTKSIAGPLSIPDSSATYVAVASPSSSYQIPTVTSGNTGITVQLTQGVTCLTVSGVFAANATGYRALGFLVQETTGPTTILSVTNGTSARSTGTTKVTCTHKFVLPSDYSIAYVSIIALQTSGGALDLSTVRITATIHGTAQNIQYNL